MLWRTIIVGTELEIQMVNYYKIRNGCWLARWGGGGS